MKTKEKKELHTKTIDELKKLLQEAKHNIIAMQLDFSQGKLKNTSSLFHKRKDIARMETIMKEKEIINENA